MFLVMIFEALLLLLMADNRPCSRYVLWRKLRLAPFCYRGDSIVFDGRNFEKEIEKKDINMMSKMENWSMRLACLLAGIYG